VPGRVDTKQCSRCVIRSETFIQWRSWRRAYVGPQSYFCVLVYRWWHAEVCLFRPRCNSVTVVQARSIKCVDECSYGLMVTVEWTVNSTYVTLSAGRTFVADRRDDRSALCSDDNSTTVSDGNVVTHSPRSVNGMPLYWPRSISARSCLCSVYDDLLTTKYLWLQHIAQGLSMMTEVHSYCSTDRAGYLIM